jgi:hypothetical protein
MLEKIKKNFYPIALVLAGIGLILMTLILIGTLGYQFTEATAIDFIENIAIIIALVLIVVGAICKRSTPFLPIAFGLYSTANILFYVYSIVRLESYSAIGYILLYVAAIVFYYITSKDKTIEIIRWVTLGTLFVIRLLQVFDGSLYGFVCVIILAIILLELLLNRNKNVEETND